VYETGAWSLDFDFGVPDAGAAILANYQFNPSASEGGAGNVGANPIYSFLVEQLGNRMRFTDSNGDAYEGNLHNPTVRTDTGLPDVTQLEAMLAEDPGQAGESLTQQVTRSVGLALPFDVRGTSGSVGVQMVGTFEVGITIFYSMQLEDTGTTVSIGLVEVFRRQGFSMRGTWIDDQGNTANIEAFGPSDLDQATVLQ
jgi:hypothetical protein